MFSGTEAIWQEQLEPVLLNFLTLQKRDAGRYPCARTCLWLALAPEQYLGRAQEAKAKSESTPMTYW